MMAAFHSTATAARTVRHLSPRDICECFKGLTIQSRSLSSTAPCYATPSLHPTTTRDQSLQNKTNKTTVYDGSQSVQPAAYKDMTPAQRAARAAERARERLQEQQQKYAATKKLGGLAENSFFADQEPAASTLTDENSTIASESQSDLSRRTLENMSLALNPRPDARARWQRKMLIRHVRRRGRLTREVQIARTERDHLSKSHFFKTSMKKLAPLARQIAGKSIDEAILQMRFSKKKAARDVRAHLTQARDEAVVIKGMGLNSATDASKVTDTHVTADPGVTPPSPIQNPTKSIKSGFDKPQTNIYVAQAWVNRGPYGMEPEYRARGKVNILRPPWTGISVLLKEEKTRTREKAEKEARSIRKRMGKNMWVQLPDRPVVRQSQYVLW